MADIQSPSWSELADDNSAPAPDGWPEGMARRDVNNSAREVMAAIKRHVNRSTATRASTGTASALILTYDQQPPQMLQGMTFAFVPHVLPVVGATLRIGTNSPYPLARSAQKPIMQGDIQPGRPTQVVFIADALGTGAFVLTSVLSDTVTPLDLDLMKQLVYQLGNTTGTSVPYPPTREQIMHRICGATMAPQNTLAGAAWALSHGLDSHETDVKFSSDGQPFLFHDDNVDSLTNGTGAFDSMTAAQIRALDAGVKWGDGRFAGEIIPTLEEYLNFTRGRIRRFYPEIKSYRTRSDIGRMISTISGFGIDDITEVASFNLDDLRYIRQTVGNGRIGLMPTAATVTPSYVLEALAMGGRVTFSIEYSFLLANPSIIALIRGSGSDLCAWTVPNFVQARALEKIGVTRIISDRPIIGKSR